MHATRAETPQNGATPTESTCLVCGGRSFTRHFPNANGVAIREHSAEPYRITHSERYLVHTLVRCTACGMVVLPQGQVAADYGDAEDPYYLEQAEERIANAHLLLDNVPAGGRLLELGCACGFLLAAARERGFSVQGIEMSVWASDYARRELGLDVATGRLETLELPAASYDVVVLADVIEHLSDPRDTVRRLHALLKPGGRLVVLTPDIGSWMARLAGTRWWGLLDDHYFYFSRSTLRRLLEQEDYAVERIHALGRRFPVRHWVFKLSQYSEALHRGVSGLTRAFGVDGLRIAINLGDQMVCVARKN
jgi:2-polyprenyl-3-methyl-5-hydroxy-6-metoxy-1,4-benzoquinol methylase